MDELLTYENFINQYPNSKISEMEYEAYYNIAKNYILGKIVYDYDFLHEDYKKQIRFYILYQINYFYENGIEKKGLVSLSINGTSQSYNDDGKRGELNISSIIKDWLNSSPLVIRKIK